MHTTMDNFSILTSIVEVAIAIAGFSGIVASLSGKGKEMSLEGKLYLKILLTASFLCISFSFFPMLLKSSGLAEPEIWIIPSYVWLGTFGTVLIIRSVGLRKSGTNMFRRPAIYVTAFLGLSAFFLCLTNVIMLISAWPYLTAMVLILFAAGFSFIALLYELLF
jgi:hypothetical protein